MDTNTSDSDRQIVAMRVDDEVFGVDIAHIQTVIMPQPITKVPQTPDFVQGVMNLRGRILPVIDLRTRFGHPAPTELDPSSRFAIIEVEGYSAGLVVDEVSEVLRISNSAIEPPSTLLRSGEQGLITGIGRTILSRRGEDPQEGFVLLLDIRRVLTDGLIEMMDQEELAAA